MLPDQANGQLAGAVRCAHASSLAIDANDRQRLDDVERHTDALGPAADHAQPGLRGARDRARVTALDDLCLFGRDRLDRRAEHLHVVERDVGDRRHAALPDVRRIEPPADADLDDADLDANAREVQERRRRQHLELGRWAVPAEEPVVGIEHIRQQRNEVHD